jgi:hypothetical protein
MAQPHSYSETIESLLIDLLRLTSEAGAKDLAVETIKCVLMARLAAVDRGAAYAQTVSGTTPTAMEILFGHLSSSRNATRASQWVKQMG